MRLRIGTLILAGLVGAGFRSAEGQSPPPFPNPPPYPAYPDPGPAPYVSTWPGSGIVICDAPGDQRDLSGTDDYAHGAYFAWSDHRGTDFDVYALRIGPDGHPVAGWNANGNLVASGPRDQTAMACVSDGPWGMFVVWVDSHSS